MTMKLTNFGFKGMSKDTSDPKHAVESYFDAHNIRITPNEGNTLLSITNEKGNAKYVEEEVKGVVLGYTTLKNILIIFTSEMDSDVDRIYILRDKVLTEYKGFWNFQTNSSIETLALYETDLVQKVYWTDGVNPIRSFIIKKLEGKEVSILGSYDLTDSEAFNVINTLNSSVSLSIEKEESSTGLFPAGTVQYAFSYFNLYESETNIFKTSSILHAATAKRGLAPDTTSSDRFKLSLSNLDTSYTYVRIYSIIRTSINSTPEIKIVADVKIEEDRTINYIDTNTVGSTVDPTLLLYLGGVSLSAETLTQKDNTLFLGNITQSRQSLKSVLEDNNITSIEYTLTQEVKERYIESMSLLYPYKN